MATRSNTTFVQVSFDPESKALLRRLVNALEGIESVAKDWKPEDVVVQMDNHYKCNRCGVESVNPAALALHIAAVHPGG